MIRQVHIPYPHTKGCMHDYVITRVLANFEGLNTPGNFAKDRSPRRYEAVLVEGSDGALHVVDPRCCEGHKPEFSLHTTQCIKGELK